MTRQTPVIALATVTLLLALLLNIAGIAAAFRDDGSNRIKLTDVQALTFYAGKYTNARRTSAIPQLECIGGSAASRRDLRPQVVQCVNRGTDGYDVQWKCEADLDTKVKFGKIDVSCEGYHDPDDPFVLKGSCGLRYELEYTAEGRASASSYSTNAYTSWNDSESESSGGSWIWSFFTIAVVFGLIYLGITMCCDWPRVGPAPAPAANGFPGYPNLGMGYGGPSPMPSAPPMYGGDGPIPSVNPSSGGGFWSGFTTGGILGYLFAPRTNTYYNPGYSTSGWGSGWAPSRSSRSSSFRSSSSGSSSSRKSTGYGGTSRR